MLNVLQQWERYFREGILREVKSAGIPFTRETLEAITVETSFRVRARKAPTFDNCFYVESGEPCHPEVDNLNCFLCSCPNYVSSREDGACKIKSKKGKYHHHSSFPLGKVWDCSDCPVNHSPNEVMEYLKKHFDQLKEAYEAV